MQAQRRQEEAGVIGITAVTSAYGAGQRLTSVALEYSEAMDGSRLTADDYAIEGLQITGVCTSDAARGEIDWTGRFVQLLVDGDPASLSLCEHVGRGPAARLSIRRPVLSVTQKRDLVTASGRTAPAFSGRPTTGIDYGIAERFSTMTFTTRNGRKLDYNLYIPEHMVAGQTYPIVLFMHDAGSCSQDTDAPLLQGTGATVWAIESYYSRRPCFVLAPHYPNVCASDDFRVTWEAEATVELLEFLCASYPVDRRRIYGTGQSMGCMMLCELMLCHPRFFAGCLLVAGQWDPERMKAAKEENLWVIVSSGDAKAFPIMRKAMNNLRDAGGNVCMSHISARADAAWLDAAIRSQKQKGANLNFTWFEGRSVIPDAQDVNPGAHHVNTWVKAYDIKALREWLFEQRL